MPCAVDETPLLSAFGVWTDTPQLAHKSFGDAASVSSSQIVLTSSKRISCAGFSELPRRFALLSPVQAGEADPLGADRVSVGQGCSYSGSPEPRGRPTLKAGAGARGVEVIPLGGKPDMA